jgi:hypothetical protein
MAQDTDTTQIRRTVEEQRQIQDEIDRIDANQSKDDEKAAAMQAGQRTYPDRFDKQHQQKPGEEHELEPAPMYEAPEYKGSEKLAGMSAIVTGADSGIGRAVAVLFAREGADVAVLYLSEDEDAQITKRAVEKEGRKCILIAGDVRERSFCEAAVRRTVDTFGRLDILVNNAAFQEHADDILDLSDAHFDQTIKTNLYGYFYMARASIPHMKPGSSIINTWSVTGIMGSGELLDYSMTKGGIHAFTRSLGLSPDPARHQGQRRRAGPRVDAAQSGGPSGGPHRKLRLRHTDGPCRAT